MSLEKLPQFFGADTFLGSVPNILSGDAGDVGVEEAEFAEFFQKVAEGFHRVLVVHVIENARWGKTDPNPIGTPNLNDGLCDFEGETAAVGHGAAIGVGAMVSTGA